VKVIHPPSFTFFCEGLKQVSLPGEVACLSEENQFMIAFNHTVAPGDYSFAIDCEIPTGVPDRTEFSVLLIDRLGFVQDAAMNIAGPIPIDSLIAQVPSFPYGFKWYPDTIVGGRVYLLEFTISIEQDVPSDPAYPPMIGEILFTLPEGFVHDIQTVSDFTNADELFEPLSKRVVDFTMQDRVRFKVDNGQYADSPATPLIIKKNMYSFRFPVIVPKQMPAKNIWFVSICDIDEGCSSPDDASVLLNFPIAGFQIGETHKLTKPKAISFTSLLSTAAIAALLML